MEEAIASIFSAQATLAEAQAGVPKAQAHLETSRGGVQQAQATGVQTEVNRSQYEAAVDLIRPGDRPLAKH